MFIALFVCMRMSQLNCYHREVASNVRNGSSFSFLNYLEPFILRQQRQRAQNLINSGKILTDRKSFKPNGTLIADRTESVTSEQRIQINWKSLKLFMSLTSLAEPSIFPGEMNLEVIKFVVVDLSVRCY